MTTMDVKLCGISAIVIILIVGMLGTAGGVGIIEGMKAAGVVLAIYLFLAEGVIFLAPIITFLPGLFKEYWHGSPLDANLDDY